MKHAAVSGLRVSKSVHLQQGCVQCRCTYVLLVSGSIQLSCTQIIRCLQYSHRAPEKLCPPSCLLSSHTECHLLARWSCRKLWVVVRQLACLEIFMVLPLSSWYHRVYKNEFPVNCGWTYAEAPLFGSRRRGATQCCSAPAQCFVSAVPTPVSGLQQRVGCPCCHQHPS